MKFKNKYVFVFGSGISGLNSISLLKKFNTFIILYDENKLINKNKLKKYLLKYYNCIIILGKFMKTIIKFIDFIVISPGISVNNLIINSILNIKKIPILGEIELAYRLSLGKKIIAITGTNGKTTTTTLLGKIIKLYIESTFIVGNIGNAYTKSVFFMNKKSYVIIEISSFQLETITKFHANISVILNITEDHLDRHYTMKNYINTKKMITKNQTKNDLCILNYNYKRFRKFSKQCIANIIFFSSLYKLKNGIFLYNNKIIININKKKILITTIDRLKLIGKHNYENIMVAIVIAYYIGIPVNIIKNTIKNFKPIKHRIEFVDKLNYIKYYNDSKGTNIDATIKAINSIKKPIILIAGGYDKKVSYNKLVKILKYKVYHLILMGQTKEKIKKIAYKYNFTNITLVKTLKEAVELSVKKAKKKCSVLLSPACSSIDQFDNYIQRGNMFKKYIKNLKYYYKKKTIN